MYYVICELIIEATNIFVHPLSRGHLDVHVKYQRNEEVGCR
jgi:hypothetical protein